MSTVSSTLQYLLLATQAILLGAVVFIAVIVKTRIAKLTKTTMTQTHEASSQSSDPADYRIPLQIMDNVLQRLIPLEISKEMNRIALEVLFNEDEVEPEEGQLPGL